MVSEGVSEAPSSRFQMADGPHICQLPLGTPSSPSTPGSIGPLPSPSLQRLSSSGSPAFYYTAGRWVWALGLDALRDSNSALLLISWGTPDKLLHVSKSHQWAAASSRNSAEDHKGADVTPQCRSRTESACCQQAARITAALTRCLILVFSPARLTYACQDSLPS